MRCRAVDFENVDIVFGERRRPRRWRWSTRARRATRSWQTTGSRAGRGRRQPYRRAGRDLRADGPVGLRQVDAAARRQRPQQGRARQGAGRATATGRSTSPTATPATLRDAAHAAASPWCSSSSRCCRGARCARMSASASSCAACRSRARRASSTRSSSWSASTQWAEQIRPRAVRRHAAARRPRARLRHRRRHPADGRAVLGARSADPRQAAGRAAASCRATLKKTIIFVSHDLDEALKIGNRIAIMEGGRDRPDAARPRTSCCARPTTMSPNSSST